MEAQTKDPGTAALISAVFPGGGQFYVGAVQSGVVSFLAFLFFLVVSIYNTAHAAPGVAIGPILWIITVTIWAANIFDAHKEAGKHNAKRAAAPAFTSAASPPFAVNSGAGEDAAVRISKLADLHKAGAITDAEFAAKKRELLERL